jgi:hypothetical protein
MRSEVAGIIDSQSIKTSAVRGPEKGYDAGKKNLGTQTARGTVDTQGHLLAVKVLTASGSDLAGGEPTPCCWGSKTSFPR